MINPDYIPTMSERMFFIGLLIVIVGILKHYEHKDEHNPLRTAKGYYFVGFCLILIAFLKLIFTEIRA